MHYSESPDLKINSSKVIFIGKLEKCLTKYLDTMPRQVDM